jgi:hypothetical protein
LEQATTGAAEDARAVALDVVRELAAAGRIAPAYLTARIGSARLPGPVLDAIDHGRRYHSGTAAVDASVRDWVAAHMVLSEQAQASLEAARQEIAQATAQPAPETPSQPATQTPPETTAQATSPTPSRSAAQPASQAAIKRPTAKAVKTMSGADLAPYVRTLLADTPDLTQVVLMSHLKIGRDKAKAALEAARESADQEPVATVYSLALGQSG